MRFLPSCSPAARVLARRGDEPATARSPLKLRLILALGGVPFFAAATVVALLGLRGDERPEPALITIAVLCATVTLAGIIDIAVLRCRLRASRRGDLGTRAEVPAQRRAGAVGAPHSPNGRSRRRDAG